MEDEMKAKQSEHELLDDAANELILADDDEPVRCARGRRRFFSLHAPLCCAAQPFSPLHPQVCIRRVLL